MSLIDPVILDISVGPVRRSEIFTWLRYLLSRYEDTERMEKGCSAYRCPDAHKLIDHLELHGLPADPLSITHPEVPENVVRKEDMGTGVLELIKQEDGDMIIVIYGRDFIGEYSKVSVEFCSPGMGGGASTNTHEALRNLAIAMRADQDARPLVALRAEQLG